MKRFYKAAGVIEGPQDFGVTLDGKPIKTPGRATITVPHRALADAIAAEWDAQDGEIRPHTMPMMQLAATVIDYFAPNRPPVEATILRFAETDTVCYRAEPGQPTELVRLQKALWDPLLDWLADRYDAPLKTVEGILAVSQPRDSLDRLAGVVGAMHDWRLGALHAAVASSGSLVIGLALVEGRIDADAAFAAAELDSGFEIDRWGEDAEATRHRAVVAADLKAARRFADLVAA